MNFLKQRLSEHAQWEIRQYANVIWEIFKEQLPWTAKAFQFYVLDYEASCEDATTKAVVMRDAIEEFVRVFELDKGWLNEGDGEKYCAILDRYQIVAYEKDNPEEYKVLRRFLEILENIE
jgi:thymidylate synthase ThyX